MMAMVMMMARVMIVMMIEVMVMVITVFSNQVSIYLFCSELRKLSNLQRTTLPSEGRRTLPCSRSWRGPWPCLPSKTLPLAPFLTSWHHHIANR